MNLMMMLLLMAGIGAFLGGVVAILFGIPVKEFSFGNTLIVVGAMAACTGLIMIALSVVVGELKTIARRVGARAVAEDRERSALAPIVPESDEDDFLFARDQSVQQDESDREPAMPPPRNGANASRARQEVQPEPEPFEPTPKARRNMMFASASRKERERAARPADIPPPPMPEASELPPLSFGDSWPKPERMRPPEALQRRPGRTPPMFAEPSAVASVRNVDQQMVTVIKSGVVDGMAYSLYSDGSIEAQMPEGLMRFASIDELRSHLEHRPG